MPMNSFTHPNLMSVSAVYAQGMDGDDDPSHDSQELRLEMRDCGGGPYLIAESARWAFDQPEELYELIKRFNKRVKPLFGDAE